MGKNGMVAMVYLLSVQASWIFCNPNHATMPANRVVRRIDRVVDCIVRSMLKDSIAVYALSLSFHFCRRHGDGDVMLLGHPIS